MPSIIETTFPDMEESVKHKTKIPINNQFFILPSDIKKDVVSFSDLKRVSLLSFEEENDYNEQGILIKGLISFFNNKGELQEREIKGHIIYVVNNDGTIQTSEGPKYINSYKENKKVKYRLLSPQEVKNKFIIKQIFSIGSNIQIGVKVSGDIFFKSIEDAKKYTKKLLFESCIINSSYLVLKMNQNYIYYSNYDIFYNGKMVGSKKSDFFEYLCSNCVSLNDTPYKYSKTFNCTPMDYVIIPLIT